MPSWNLEASAGAVGAALLWRGTWSNALSYNPNNAVERNGSSYVSLTNNSNIDPATDGGTNWSLMATATGSSLYRPSGVLHSQPNTVITATANVELVVWTYNVSASLLSRDGDALRVTFYGVIGGTSGTRQLRLKWDGTSQFLISYTGATPVHHCITVQMYRQSQTAQRWIVGRTSDVGNGNCETSTSASDLSLSIPLTLAVFSSVGPATGTARIEASTLEFLPAP